MPRRRCIWKVRARVRKPSSAKGGGLAHFLGLKELILFTITSTMTITITITTARLIQVGILDFPCQSQKAAAKAITGSTSLG